MQNQDYSIRTMNRDEIDIAMDWAALEGWNPGLHDAASYSIADPNGFLIGMLRGQPVSTISVIRYSDTFGFLGFYIVKPEYRGNGYGLQIWNAGLEYLGGRNIGLDGVVMQQDNYTRSGFRFSHRNIRYQGPGGSSSQQSPNIVELATLPFETIALYDRPFFPADRSRFLKTWVSQPDSHSLGILERKSLAGYGVIRKCRFGYKIGPLIADTAELGESLFVALKSRVKSSESVFLDIPEVNPSAISMAEKHNMEISFETARMYTGQAPVIPLTRLYGVLSFEIG